MIRQLLHGWKKQRLTLRVQPVSILRYGYHHCSDDETRIWPFAKVSLHGFIDSIFKLMEPAFRCPDYSLISKRAKTVKISIKTPIRAEISHLVIDGTGLKVFGEGEWKGRHHVPPKGEWGVRCILSPTV